MYFKKVQVGL